MIQRIQSLFLLASLCFLVPLFFVPIADLLYDTGEMFTFNFSGFCLVEAGQTSCKNEFSIMASAILICALNLVTIFMYKNRLLQIRLCIYNILLLFGLTGVSFFVLYNIPNAEPAAFRLPVVFPVVSVILHYLAFRAIRRDHFMVEALSRLR